MSVQRKYQYTVSELLDRLSILTLKHLHNKELKSQYAEEIENVVHDINLGLMDLQGSSHVHAEFLHAVIILAQFNTHIWNNEDNARKGDRSGNELFKTHVWNGIRVRAKSIISKKLNERTDPKVNALSAEQLDDEPKW